MPETNFLNVPLLTTHVMQTTGIKTVPHRLGSALLETLSGEGDSVMSHLDCDVVLMQC